GSAEVHRGSWQRDAFGRVLYVVGGRDGQDATEEYVGHAYRRFDWDARYEGARDCVCTRSAAGVWAADDRGGLWDSGRAVGHCSRCDAGGGGAAGGDDD